MNAVEKLLRWPQIPYFTHALNLIEQHTIAEIKPLRIKPKNIIEYFKDSHVHRNDSKETLKQEAPAKWNSALIMIDSIAENEGVILSKLVLFNPAIVLQAEEFKILKEMCKVLKMIRSRF